MTDRGIFVLEILKIYKILCCQLHSSMTYIGALMYMI